MDFTYLDKFLDSLLEIGFPMYDTTVQVAGKEVYRRQGGYIDVEKKRTHEGKNLYFIYSCSKPITCAAALTLLEQGKINLSDPVSDYLPSYKELTVAEKREDGTVEIRPAKTVMTLRHLFTHTSGLSYNRNTAPVNEVIAKTDKRAPTVQVCAAYAKSPLLFDPGEKWSYSLAHDVLAAVVEVVSGRRFSDYVRETVFAPLGMEDSSFATYTASHDPNNIPRFAQQYRFKSDFSGLDIVGLNCSYMFGSEYESGGAGVVTTAEDYIKFASAMAMGGIGANGARILAPSTVSLMRTDALNEQQRRTLTWKQYLGYSYGLGVRTLVDRAAGGALSGLGEFGWGGAAGALTIFDPDSQVAVYHAQHTLSPREEYVFPRLRNIVFACLGR